MKRSSLKELLIFVLWLLTDTFGSIALIKAHLSHYFPVYYLAIALIFEMYIFFQLPGAKYFWNAAEHAEDPRHGKIRLFVMACVVVFLIFVLKGAYFLAFYFIATIRIDGIINFFRVSHEERHRILETEGIPELKSYLYIFVVTPIATALFAVCFLWFVFHSSKKHSIKKNHTVSFYQVSDVNLKF